MTASLESEIAQLTQEEKITLIGKLWNSLDADTLPVPPAVLAELDRRWADHQINPGAALSLDELMARVEAKRR